MFRRISIALCVVLCIGVWRASAQKFRYDLDFGTFIDNGEYNSHYKQPQTMAGVFLNPTVGLSIDTVHRFMVGVGAVQEFGTPTFSRVPSLLAYYRYSKDSFNGWVGILPNRDMSRGYSRALFSDSVSYFKHSIAGALVQWSGERGEIEAFFDWTNLDRTTGAEAFMAGSAGKLNLGHFGVGYSGYMYHYRPAKGSENFLVDNVMWRLYGSVDLSSGTPLDRLYIELGAVGSATRGRISATKAGEWTPRAGVQALFGIEWHGWGFEDTFYAGGGLLPLFDKYGTQVYWGDSFYNAPIYNRSDVYWRYAFKKMVDVKVALVLHATAKGLDFCQQATVRFRFGN